MPWDYIVLDEIGSVAYVGTEEECTEWAALNGAERQTTYRVRPYKPPTI